MATLWSWLLGKLTPDLSLGVQGQPGQHSETLTQKKEKEERIDKRINDCHMFSGVFPSCYFRSKTEVQRPLGGSLTGFTGALTWERSFH